MNSKIVLPVIGLMTVLWLAPRRTPVKGVNPAVTAAPSASVATAPSPRLEAATPKVTPKAEFKNTKFVTKQELVQLRAVLEDVGDTVDVERRKEDFKLSGLDTKEHTESAMAIVSADYPETLSQADTEARVLALHHLDLSSQLDAEGCRALLKKSIGKFTSVNDRQRALPYLWDLHDIALTCTKLDPQGMVELQRSIEHPKVSAQLKLVLKTKGAI